MHLEKYKRRSTLQSFAFLLNDYDTVNIDESLFYADNALYLLYCLFVNATTIGV